MERSNVLAVETTALLVTAISIVAVFGSCTYTQGVTTNGSELEDTLSTATSVPHMDSLVRGRIIFKSSRPELTGATIYIRLEDVSRADASSHLVSEQVIENPAEYVSAEGIPFVLSGNQGDLNSQRRYSVSVHIDMDGSGEISGGDYISTESNPVLTQGHPNHVTVLVEKVD